ncbi:hypothetical protein HispidOSU_022742 [Sigmodon hispidus]
MATLNTALPSQTYHQPHLQPLSRGGTSYPSTVPSQSHPDSGVQQQDHLQTYKEQLFPLTESSSCLWDLAKIKAKHEVTSKDNSIYSVPNNTRQKGNEKLSLGTMLLCS